MITEKIYGHTVEIYNSIEDLPIKRFHKYNKMLLVDSGIGSTVADFDAHIVKIIAHIKKNSPQNAMTELQNLRQNVYMIQSEISPKLLAFACLVKSIDGKECNDISDEGLKAVTEKLSPASMKIITALFDAVKKKIDDELVLFFPKIFEDSSIKEFYDYLRKRTMLVLDGIIEGESKQRENEIEKLTITMMTYSKPHSFEGKDNAEVAHDKNFERICVSLTQHLHADPKKYTVLEFYNAYEYINDMINEQIKANKAQKSRLRQ